MQLKHLLAAFLALATLPPSAALWSQGWDKRQRFTVAATNPEWTATGIQISAGDLVAIAAGGRVRIGPSSGEVGPGGTASGEGALELKIGVAASMHVGELAYLIAANAGEIKLRVNDSRYNDNAGAFVVSMTYMPQFVVPNALGAQTESVSEDFVRQLSEMKTTLRRLVTAEEAFYADSVRYSRSVAPLSFTPVLGVTVSLDSVEKVAWRGTAKHSGLPGWICGMYVGAVPPYSPGQNEGDPICWKAQTSRSQDRGRQ